MFSLVQFSKCRRIIRATVRDSADSRGSTVFAYWLRQVFLKNGCKTVVVVVQIHVEL